MWQAQRPYSVSNLAHSQTHNEERKGTNDVINLV